MDKKLLEYASIAKSGKWENADLSLLTLENIKLLKKEGCNLLAIADTWGMIGKLPPKLIGEDGILFQDEKLKTAIIQLAADNGILSIIPRKYLTQQNLMLESHMYGYTTFHYAAKKGCLQTIPKELLTEENLSTNSSYDGQTPLGMATHALKSLELSEKPEDKEKIPDVEAGINLILKTIPTKKLDEIYKLNGVGTSLGVINKNVLPYIKKELTKRRVLSELNKKQEDFIEI